MKRLLLLVLMVAGVAPALANDIVPAPWRGAEGTTYARYEFLTPEDAPLPDQLVNPYGQPTALMTPGVGQQWWPDWGDVRGVWPLSGRADFLIPNRPEPLPFKEIWIQLTWAEQVPEAAPVVLIGLPGAEPKPATLFGSVILGPTGEPPPAGASWVHAVYTFRIEPNPPGELITIGGAIMVDEIVIETICAPEPQSLAFLALAAMPLLRRRG